VAVFADGVAVFADGVAVFADGVGANKNREAVNLAVRLWLSGVGCSGLARIAMALRPDRFTLPHQRAL
jgi:hypothetical protein